MWAERDKINTRSVSDRWWQERRDVGYKQYKRISAGVFSGCPVVRTPCFQCRRLIKLQYFGHLMPRAKTLEKTLVLGKIVGRRRRGRERMRWWGGITALMDMSLSKLQETVKDREAWRAVVHGVTKSWTWLNNGTTTTTQLLGCKYFLSRH